MSDNIYQYRAIRKALHDLYSREPQGNLARHLNTLAALIRGIVGSQRTNLPAGAGKVPDGTKRESRVKRFSRWLVNEGITLETSFMPYAEALIARLAHRPLVLVRDGSEVGRGCLTLMVSAVDKKRASPLAWIVVKGSKGPFPEESPVALLEQVHSLVPEEADVLFLGDGEFDGTPLQATVEGYGWSYGGRTAKNIILADEGEEFTFEERGIMPGEILRLPEVTFTRQAYGPIHALAWWRKGYKEPLYLITNLELAEEACSGYAKRFRIETFFSDQKSRGFNWHKTHLSDPGRLARLMSVTGLASIWTLYLGVSAKRGGWVKIIHRTDRCDLSLFQLGLNLLEHFLNEHLPIPVAFQMPDLAKSVR